MSRPLRIQFPGALYHVTARGNRRGSIFENEEDCEAFLRILAQATDRFDGQFWQRGLRGQIYLGDEGFAQRMRDQAAATQLRADEVPKAQRRPKGTLADCLAQTTDRGEALSRGHRVLGLSMTEMARGLGLSVSRVSRLIAAWERGRVAELRR